MGEILILACYDCDQIFEKNIHEKCPRCDSIDYEIIDVENEDV